ncbi:MAG: hypothetical protein Q9M32_04330 [Sulfurimonas sp.]|nr:hypothetical protein [Sulfurimonas sp.]MDQ7061962.1 hypothetical protein [Sulfurimonas sp.]
MNREELVENIFSNKSDFEKEVLNVLKEKDKSEIMHILAYSIVRDTLKEHLNFLHIKSLSDFTLKPVVNILFKEIANEWISYAMDLLDYSKEEALEILQNAHRVKLLHTLADDYFKHYKGYIYEEIADTFIDLLASMNQASDKVLLVNAVINSDLIANRSVLGINSFNQLYRRIIAAKNLKNIEVSALQIKLSDILIELDCNSTSAQRREILMSILPQYEEKNKKMSQMKLETFDASLQRVKRAILNALKNNSYKL